ncbi:hypothetical protein HK101_001978 [Irineochytrium annulatum]|nr:hypothetical protein HK101_001978 [Irineochytrium annulatum]
MLGDDEMDTGSGSTATATKTPVSRGKKARANSTKLISSIQNAVKLEFQELADEVLLARREEDVEFREKKVAEFWTNDKSETKPVVLRVGDRIFHTSRDVLLSEPDSYFSGMLSNNYKQQDGEPFFVPRDGDAFEHILYFLIHGTLLNELPAPMKSRLLLEAEYYSLTRLTEELTYGPFWTDDENGVLVLDNAFNSAYSLVFTATKCDKTLYELTEVLAEAKATQLDPDEAGAAHGKQREDAEAEPAPSEVVDSMVVQPVNRITVIDGYDPSHDYHFKIQIVYEDINFLVVNKPYGNPSVVLDIFSSLTPHFRHYLRIDGPTHASPTEEQLLLKHLTHLPRLFMIHQLDFVTSGLHLWGLTRRSTGRAASLFRQRLVRKRYDAVVVGDMHDCTIEAALAEVEGCKDKKVGVVPDALVATTPGARLATTHVKRIKGGVYAPTGRRVTFLEVSPVTGRRHQIRVHLLSSGHPILGDYLYEDDWTEQIGRTMLHARSMVMPFKTGGLGTMEWDVGDTFTQMKGFVWDEE